MKWKALLAALVLVPMLSGCPGFWQKPDGTPIEMVAPKNFQESSLVATSTLLTVRKTLRTMQTKALLPEEKVQEYNRQIDEVRKRIETAPGYWQGGNQSVADITLDAALSILINIRKEIGNGE